MKYHTSTKRRYYVASTLAFLSFCFVGSLYQQCRKLSLSSGSVNGNPRNLKSSSIATAVHSSVLEAPIGGLGPKGSPRQNMLYYDFLLLLCMKYGGTSKSLLEVGCATDPFAQHLNWMERRACLAPYFASYHGGKTDVTGEEAKAPIQQVTADFYKWDNPEKKTYDLLICNQVLEHVPDPKTFLQKLITTSRKTTIISVPYKWPDCGKDCGHVTHHIDLDTVLEWAAPHKPAFTSVVTEDGLSASTSKRLFAVFTH